MAKPIPLLGEDLITQAKNQPLEEKNVPLQFKMPAEFVREFKRQALDQDLKLNEFLRMCFNEWLRAKKESPQHKARG